MFVMSMAYIWWPLVTPYLVLTFLLRQMCEWHSQNKNTSILRQSSLIYLRLCFIYIITTCLFKVTFYIKTLGSLKKHVVTNIPPSLHSCLIAHPLDSTVACFDGATLANWKCSGARGIIKTSATTVYRWYLNCGEGTNTKA